MKRYTEFRGRLTSIEYDAAAGTFSQVAAPHPFIAAQEEPPGQAEEAADKPVTASDPAGDERLSDLEMHQELNGHVRQDGARDGNAVPQNSRWSEGLGDRQGRSRAERRHGGLRCANADMPRSNPSAPS
jgi:hypothetical protein